MPHVLPLVDGPVYGTPLTLALRRAEAARSTGSTTTTDLRAGAAARPRHGRPVRRSSSSASRTACRTAWRWPSTRRSASIVHTGDFKIDQTPLDGEHFDLHRFAELGADGRAGAASPTARTSIGRGFTGSELEVVDAFEEIFTSADGQADRRRVRVEHLPDADPGRSGGAVRPQGGLRRPRHDARTRRSRSGSATCGSRPGVQIRDSRRRQLPGPGRALPHDRVAGRADVGAVAHRDRRSSAREARARTTRSCSRRASIPGNEKAIGRVMNHLARRGADVIHEGDQARARVGARQRRGAEADAVARAAALLRAHPRRVPAARRSTRASPSASSPGASRSPTILLAENGDILRVRRAGARASPARRRSGRVLIDGTRTGEVGDEVLRDRRHLAEDGLVVPVVAINKQTGRARGRARHHHARVRHGGQPGAAGRRRAAARARSSSRRASRSAPTRGSSRRSCAWSCAASSASVRAGGRSCCPSSWRSDT